MVTRLRSSCAVAAAALALATVSLPPSAEAGAGAAPASASSSHAEAPQTTDLAPIVVNGTSVPLPTALQMLKEALARPWSTASADRYKIVCRVLNGNSMTQRVLHCETNATHFHMNAGLAGGGNSAQMALTNAGIAMQLGKWVDDHVTNVGELERTLKKLPPPGSSYTLRLTGGHQDTVEYVVDHGELAAKYVIRNGKQILVWSRNGNGGQTR